MLVYLCSLRALSTVPVLSKGGGMSIHNCYRMNYALLDVCISSIRVVLFIDEASSILYLSASNTFS